MKTVLSVLFIAATVVATKADYVAPVASGFIYRNDHNGPASLIQLGAVPYHQPLAFAPPLPLTQPLAQPLKLKALEAYDLEPAPLPYVAVKPIVEEDSDEEDDDDIDGASEENANEDLVGYKLGHAFVKGGGSDYEEKHHAAHGEKGSKGYKSSNNHAKGASGHYGKKHDEGYYSEGEGVIKSHHNEADAHGKHHNSVKGYKGGNHGHKKHFSKGEDVTGYHKVFHKDEFKKDHDFYDVADNSGHFNKHGYEKEKHGSSEGAHRKGGHHKAAYGKGDFGKGGFHAKVHSDKSDLSHSAEEGNESHYRQGKNFGRKGGSAHEKEYAYQEDDEIEEDEE